ncbi:MAG TPA: DUF2914 domain-containing protein [Bdellovibrionota bacterium]|nr:DUF2914 domain-containing protein [Bdellovibrionota bacterium]
MRKLWNILVLVVLVPFLSHCAKQGKSVTPSPAPEKKETIVGKTAEKKAVTEKAEEKKSADGLHILEAVVCRSIENRAPVGTSNAFPADVGRLYVFTKLATTESDSSIMHVWYFGNKEVGTVKLPVRGPQWRTYSSKTVNPSQKGEWRVEVKTANDHLLESVSFKVE